MANSLAAQTIADAIKAISNAPAAPPIPARGKHVSPAPSTSISSKVKKPAKRIAIPADIPETDDEMYAKIDEEAQKAVKAELEARKAQPKAEPAPAFGKPKDAHPQRTKKAPVPVTVAPAETPAAPAKEKRRADMTDAERKAHDKEVWLRRVAKKVAEAGLAIPAPTPDSAPVPTPAPAPAPSPAIDGFLLDIVDAARRGAYDEVLDAVRAIRFALK